MSTLVDPLELQAVLNLAGSTLYEPATYERIADAADEVLTPYLAGEPADLATVAPVREAALAIAVDLWSHRLAPGGQMQAADWTPGPWRLGRSLLSRVTGLLGPYLDADAMVG